MAIRIKNDAKLELRRTLTFSEGARVYAQLREEVTRAGILKRAYWYYAFLSIVDIGLFVFFVQQFIVQTNPLLVALSIIGIGFFTVRIGGLIHDAGHRAVFRSPRLNDLFGYMTSFFIAFPYTVWRIKHNAHHAHTNEEGEDPDVEVPISFTEEMFKRHTIVVKLIRRHQHWLYYVLGPLLSFTIRLKSFRYYATNMNVRAAVEMTALVAGLAVWYVVPFVFFPVWKAVLFLLLVNGTAGFYMMNVFAPNHKGMPYLEKGTRFSFIEHQIMTARNLYGHWMTDYVYLGLNYQIEHHLFPDCPRYKLKKITPYVLAVCKKYGLTYTQASIIETNKIIYSELKKVAQTSLNP